MAKYIVDGEDLAGIADAIREKTGSEEPIMFPNGFIDDISGITTSNPVADEVLVRPVSVNCSLKSSVYSFAASFCSYSNGIGTFPSYYSANYMTISFIPLVDLYAYLNSTPSNKITLTAGTTYYYKFAASSSSPPTYTTQIYISDSNPLLDSGSKTTYDSIKVTKI